MRIAFTGGGTGGHVMPGIAVLEVLQSKLPKGADWMWLGSGKGIEASILADREDLSYVTVPTGKLRRYFSLQNLTDAFRVLAGVFVSLAVFLSRRPAFLFSKGGFVAVPPVIAARLLGIPVVIHESDFDPGLATRITARFASRICVSYEETKDYFPSRTRERIRVTGNPIRQEILRGDATMGRAILGASENEAIVVVMGGSQGARQLNEAVRRHLDLAHEGVRIFHQTGDVDFVPSETSGYVAKPFVRAELPHILAAADLVVCRAGASTVWENGVIGKPAVLMPLVEGSRGDQARNARYFVDRGAAELAEPDLGAQIRRLLSDSERLAAMSSAAVAACNVDAPERIAEVCREVMPWR